KRASAATEQGDRERALDALEDMRKASRALDADQREQGNALRSIRDELDGAKSAAGASAPRAAGGGGQQSSTTASEALSRMKRELEAKKGDPEEIKKLADRLERAR